MMTPPVKDQRTIAYELEKLGEIIRNRRSTLELSLVEASAQAGVSTSVMSRLENGKAVGTYSLVKVFRGLGLGLGVAPRAEVGSPFSPATFGQGGDSHDKVVRDFSRVKLPIFYATQLRNTPPRTPEDVKRLMAKGRHAEMTPRLAGDDDDES